MKLKLSTKAHAPPEAAPAPAPPAPPAPAGEAPSGAPGPPGPPGPKKIVLKIPGAAAADNQPGDAKPKRKYTKKAKVDEGGSVFAGPKTAKIKKRPRDDMADDAAPTAKRKSKPTAKSLAQMPSDDDLDDEPAPMSASHRAPPVRQGSTLKIKMKAPGQKGPPGTTGPPLIKITGIHGKPPARPPGVGYDSEAEEAESDPAIESQFVLRMQPGPDCDLLRKAIEEKKVGKPSSEGGTPVFFRFFDREGRHSMVSIQGHLYAAAMVDLPCVVESMKSWNKRDWVKTADICQMLLILGRVNNEAEAKNYPLPREVDPHKHQYPHGLTPPMHSVRRRRFRPRQSYHEIEQREAEVSALLQADEEARKSGGSSEYQIIKEDAAESDEEPSEGEQGARSESEDIANTTELVYEGETPGGEQVNIDHDELAKAFEAGLMDEDSDHEDEDHYQDQNQPQAHQQDQHHPQTHDLDDAMGEDDDLFGDDADAEGEPMETETPLTAHDVAVHALGEKAHPPTDTAASSPGAGTSADDDEDEDDDDDAESPVGEVVDAEAVAAAESREQNMAEIRELETEIAASQAAHDSNTNKLWRKKQLRKIEQLQSDLDLKKKALGIGDDGDY